MYCFIWESETNSIFIDTETINYVFLIWHGQSLKKIQTYVAEKKYWVGAILMAGSG